MNFASQENNQILALEDDNQKFDTPTKQSYENRKRNSGGYSMNQKE